MMGTGNQATRIAGHHGGSRYPNLFLVGAPKCGTTSLAYYLGQHPDILVPAIKEPMFYGSDIITDAQRLTAAEYLALYENWREERYALDASPVYLVTENAAREIAGTSPEARIIVSVRNPVDAAFSDFHHNRYRLTEAIGSFEAALDAEDGRARQGVPPERGSLQSLLYRRVFSYAQNIPRFINVFGAEHVRVVLADDLRVTPLNVVQGIVEWLDLDPLVVASFDFQHKNIAGRARSQWLSLLAIHPPAWIGRFTKPLFPLETRAKVRGLIRRFNTVPEANPPMNPETRKRLIETFRPDVLWLSDYMGRDLSHWLEPDD